jgi:hypothetical protein
MHCGNVFDKSSLQGKLRIQKRELHVKGKKTADDYHSILSRIHQKTPLWTSRSLPVYKKDVICLFEEEMGGGENIKKKMEYNKSQGIRKRPARGE